MKSMGIEITYDKVKAEYLKGIKLNGKSEK